MSSVKTNSILDRLQRDLDRLRAEAQYRSLEEVRGIHLCSNDYLGLRDDLRLKRAIIDAVGNLRVGSTGSRLLSGDAAVWHELESQFAAFIGAEASIFLTSGYLANVGLLSSLAGPGDLIFSDSANHASLIDGIRLSRAAKVIFPHGDLEQLEKVLRGARNPGARFIVVESVYSMDGDRAALPDLVKLAERYDAGLIVDEAHATGVFGANGSGLVSLQNRPECVIATIHPCGKAFASMGAFIAGSATLCDFLLNRARSFIFSTALPPYFAAQLKEAVRLIPTLNERRTHLLGLADQLRRDLKANGFSTGLSESQIIPILLGNNETALRVAHELNDQGFGVKAIRPPTIPAGTSRLRLSLTSDLKVEQLESFVQVLKRSVAL